MDTDGSLLLFTFFYILTLLAAGFFTLSQASIIALSDAKLKKLCDDGVKKALRVKKLVEKPSFFKGTAEFGFLGFSALSAVLAFFFYYPPLTLLFATKVFPAEFSSLAGISSFLVVFFASLFLVLIFARTIPYHVGSGHPDRFAFLCAPLLKFVQFFLAPGVKIVQGISFGAAKLTGTDPTKTGEEVTEEEIRMMMDVGSEKGVIEESQMEMINNIFEFDDSTAADVMTHRTDIVAVPRTARISDVVFLSTSEGFSRIPVYEDDIDNIVGTVYVKDLLVLVNCENSDSFTVNDFLRPVPYIPASAKLPDLFRQLTAKKAHLAIVIDEYGGTSGLLTMEDLIEAIVGNIQDEYDEEDDEITRLDENVFTVDGTVEPEELGKAMGVEFTETDDYDTVSGMIIYHLGRIPSPDEEIKIEIEGVEFTVLLVEDRRIERVKAVRVPKGRTAEDADED